MAGLAGAGPCLWIRGPVDDWISARVRLIDLGQDLVLADEAGFVLQGVLPGSDLGAMQSSEPVSGPRLALGLSCQHYSGDLHVGLLFDGGRLVETRRLPSGKACAVSSRLATVHRWLFGTNSLIAAEASIIEWTRAPTLLLVVSGYLPDPVVCPTAASASRTLDLFYALDSWLATKEGWRHRLKIGRDA